MKKKIVFYGLLHVNDNDQNLNFKFKNNLQKIEIYFLNAILLAKSLQKKKFKFILLTNNKKYLKNFNFNNFLLNIEEIEFVTKIIKESHFSSCHYRLDIFKFLSHKHHYSALVDLDVVAINDISTKIKELLNASDRVAFVNDITNQVIPAYGIEKVKKNLELVLNQKSEVKWYGGDLFFGPPEFFKDLHAAAINTYNSFKLNFNSLRDQTDELFISAAIEILKKSKKFEILNSSDFGLLDRYWSVNTKHPQRSLDELKKNFLIHFPADKIFLSKISHKEYSDEAYIKLYSKYAFSAKKSFYNIIVKIKNYL